MDKPLLLLECHETNLTWMDVWFKHMGPNLNLVPQGKHKGIIAVLNNMTEIEKLAEWIEEEDETFDDVPLFIIWVGEHSKRSVHEYGPFENSIRQLVKVHAV